MAIRSRTFKETYREDIKLFQTIWIKFWLAIFFLGLLSAPLWADPYIIYMANIAGIAAIGAIGLNILTGFTGQISLGHAAFVAIGAYTSALLAHHTGIPFYVNILIGGLVAASFGIILGLPCLRLKGLYLAMATMSFGVVVEYTITHWDSLTRGVRGFRVPPVTLFGHILNDDATFFYVLMLFLLLLTIAAKNIIRTRVGRAFVAIRDRDVAAETMGVDVTKYKVMAFGISAFYGGVAGGLYGYYTAYVLPENFSVLLSIEYVAMVIVGGMGSISGSILGAAFLTLIPDIIKGLTEFIGQYISLFQDIYNDEWNIASFGLLIIVFLIVEPKGLNGIWIRIKTCFKEWPFTY